MASLYKKKDGSWWAIFTVHYKQKWIKLGKMSKTSAKEALRKLEEDYSKKKFDVTDERNIYFDEYAKEYLNFSRANKALRSHQRDETSMKRLLESFGSITLPRIKSHLIEKHKIKRIKEVSPRTVNIELLCISHMLNKAVEWGYLKDSPAKGVKLLKYAKTPPRFLTKEETALLLKNSSAWLKPIVVIMLNTGIREGERRQLKFEDIDYEHSRVLIHASKTKDYRSIPLNSEALNVFQWLEKNYVAHFTQERMKRDKSQKDYVFCHEDGSPVENIKKAFANACRKAGLKRVTPHTLRHTFASHLIMSGVDLRTVQRLLGHKNISTTMMYAHLTEDHLARGVEKLTWT